MKVEISFVSASIAVNVHTVAKPEDASLLRGDVLRLRVAERPDLIYLQGLARSVSSM
jgi:hypothetical protein